MHKTSLTFVVGALAVALAGGIVLAQTGEATQVGIGELANRPATYAGQLVTITGEVEEVLGPRLIAISEDTPFDLFDDQVLVHVPTSVAVALRTDQNVTVTGRVRSVTEINLDEELGWFEPEPDIEAEFNRQSVIMATLITSDDIDATAIWEIDRTGMPMAAAQPGQAGADQPVGTRGTAAAPVTMIDPLVRPDAGALVGRVVNLSAPVARVTGDRTFTIGMGDQRILVLVAEPLRARGPWEQNVNPGSNVTVSGLVLEMPREVPVQGLTAEEQRLLSGRDVYIYATRIATKGQA